MPSTDAPGGCPRGIGTRAHTRNRDMLLYALVQYIERNDIGLKVEDGRLRVTGASAGGAPAGFRPRWWLWVGSNQRPRHYDCGSLTG